MGVQKRQSDHTLTGNVDANVVQAEHGCPEKAERSRFSSLPIMAVR